MFVIYKNDSLCRVRTLGTMNKCKLKHSKYGNILDRAYALGNKTNPFSVRVIIGNRLVLSASHILVYT